MKTSDSVVNVNKMKKEVRNNKNQNLIINMIVNVQLKLWLCRSDICSGVLR